MAVVVPEHPLEHELSEVELDAIVWAVEHAAKGQAAWVAIDRIVLLFLDMPLDRIPEGVKVDLRRIRIDKPSWLKIADTIDSRQKGGSLVWMNKGPSAIKGGNR